MLNRSRASLQITHIGRGQTRVLAACCLLITACTAQAGRMVVSSESTPSPFPDQWKHNLCVRNVGGGETFNLLSQPGVVESDAFRSAFEQSLERNLLLAEPSGCKYYIDVDILGVSQPSRGIFITSVEAISHVNYKVFDRNQKPVLLDTVSATYTAGFSDAVVGAVRVERASEGAVRANFEKFLEDLRTKPALTSSTLMEDDGARRLSPPLEGRAA